MSWWHVQTKVQLTVDGLVKALKVLRSNQCGNIEARLREFGSLHFTALLHMSLRAWYGIGAQVYADVYREISKHSISPEQRETLRQLVFVGGTLKPQVAQFRTDHW